MAPAASHRAILGVLPSRAPGVAAAASPKVQSPVIHHGGVVQHWANTTAIFWAPNATSFPGNYQTIVTKFLTDVAADSFKPTNVFGAGTQYYDVTNSVKQPVFYAIANKPAIVDTHAYPANGCPNYRLADGTTSTHCLTNTQLVNEIKSVITENSLPTGITMNFFLITPRGIASCKSSGALSKGGCYDPMGHPGFCAYHSHMLFNQHNVLFANMPFAAIAGCSSGQSPQGNKADSLLNTISHEFLETMTDPLGTGWYDSNGKEIADKCAYTYGAPLGENAYGKYNQMINGHSYWLQEAWSNRVSACVQRNTFVQPVASFTYTPAEPASGEPVTFQSTSSNPDGAALKLRWVFPNGTTSASANPTYTFPTAYAYPVSLVVWDAQGDQARVIVMVQVT